MASSVTLQQLCECFLFGVLDYQLNSVAYSMYTVFPTYVKPMQVFVLEWSLSDQVEGQVK